MACLDRAVAEKPQKPVPISRLCWAAFFALLIMPVSSAWPLSELIQEDMQPPPDPELMIEREPLPPPPDYSIPLPDPIRPPLQIDDTGSETLSDEPEAETRTDPPEIIYDPERLPEAVRATRERLMEIARSGDIEGLRPLLGEGEEATLLSHGPPQEDPAGYLRSISGDTDGHEVLAILYEVLESGFVRLETDDDEAIYVWPYFYALPLEDLDPRQRVELFMLVTAGDYEDMKAYGSYIFYRAGIAPDGRWVFFLAGH
jgi:hypothetical protein